MAGVRARFPRKDLTGRVFGLLTVVRPVRDARGDWAWECRCSCGQSHVASAGHLRRDCRSCGCLRKANTSQMFHRHGKTNTVEHNTWAWMRSRCLNPKNQRYAAYGGRGIKICERWMIFENFLTDMGQRPGKGYSIERIDNNGHYEPNNCKWATSAEQNRNTRQNVLITYKGETLTMSDWAKQFGLKRPTVSYRLRHGWDAGAALTTPVGTRRTQSGIALAGQAYEQNRK